MTTFEDDIADSVKLVVVGKLRRIRSAIEDLKSYYGLDTETVSNRRRISTRLVILAIDLTECLSKYLHSYGEVPESEQPILDDRGSRLEALLNEVN
jgi:hypothetical protein